MIKIKEVVTKKDIKAFIEFPLELYKGNPYFVPPLYGDEKALFKKDFMYSDQAEAVYYLAERDGKVVGRISGILQRASNEKWGQKRIRFTRFDSVDDQEVATALFNKVEEWAKSKGMNEVVGPLGFSDLDREGLLIEGFDQLSTFEEQYNYDYYQRLIENCGYGKDVDWVERRLRLPDEPDDRLERLSAVMMKRYKLHFGEAKNTNDFLKKYAEKFFEILDDTYSNLYMTVPFTDKMKKSLIANFKLIIDLRFVAVILDENDNVVCFGLCFPGIGKALQKSGGRLTLPTIVKLLKEIKNPTTIDLGLIGVRPEYAKKGVASALIAQVMIMLQHKGIEYAETNLNLEDNLNIQNQWKAFNNVLHKRRRSFVKKLEE